MRLVGALGLLGMLEAEKEEVGDMVEKDAEEVVAVFPKKEEDELMTGVGRTAQGMSLRDGLKNRKKERI